MKSKILFISILAFMALFLGILSYLIFINHESSPQDYNFPPPAARSFHIKLQNYLNQNMTNIYIKDLTDFNWMFVCYWGSYGTSHDHNLAAVKLKIKADKLWNLVYEREGVQTLIFKKEDNVIVPIYLDTSHEKTYRRIQFKHHMEQACFSQSEAQLKIK